MSAHRVIFFDGVCNLCDSFVSFLISLGLPPSMKVSSLQGKFSEQVLSPQQREKLSSVLYLREQNLFRESTAVLYILGDLKWYFKPLMIFLLVPAFVRDSLYRFVAKNRYRWFGKKQTCRLPLEHERRYFLE